MPQLKTPIFDFCYMKTRLQRFQKPLSIYKSPRNSTKSSLSSSSSSSSLCAVAVAFFSAENLLEKSRFEIYLLICFRAVVAETSTNPWSFDTISNDNIQNMGKFSEMLSLYAYHSQENRDSLESI